LPEHAPWIEDALAEVTRFTGNDKQDAHDDVVDTLSYAAKLFTVNEQQKAGGFAPYFSGGRR
jgi:phage terminase large subunit-like protein